VARSRDPERESEVILPLRTYRAVGAVQSRLGVGERGREILVLATCSLQFAKAGSFATLSKQEKHNSADAQRAGFIYRGDAPSASSSGWTIASRRARHRRQIFEPQLRRLRLRLKTSAWATSGPAGGIKNHFLRPKTATSAKSITSPAVRDLGAGLQRPCHGQTCGGMLSAMERISPERPATRPTTAFFSKDLYCRVSYRNSKSGPGLAVPDGRTRRTQANRQTHDHHFFTIQRFLMNPPCSVAAIVVNSEPHTGTRLSSIVYGANNCCIARLRFFYIMPAGARRRSVAGFDGEALPQEAAASSTVGRPWARLEEAPRAHEGLRIVLGVSFLLSIL